MDSTSRRSFLASAVAVAGIGLSLHAQAQEFPSKPVKIVVGFGPAVGIEVSTRILAELVTKELGQQVVVENKPGASTQIAANYVAQAPKDGYTLLLLNTQQYNNHLMYKNVSYKPSNFIPFAAGGILSLVMITNKDVPATTVREFVEYAKANPGKLNFGYWGSGGSPHIMGTRMQAVSGITMQAVGYKDAAQATVDLVAGRIHMFFTSAIHGLSVAQSGQGNVVAIGTPRRISSLPDVPTFDESGVQDLPSIWWGYAVPAGTPAPVVAKLERAFKAAMATPRYQKMLADTASVPLSFDSPAKMGEYIERESERWASAIRPLNLKFD